MLLKLAFQNIRSSKGYFIAYMITISVFFALIYQVTNLSGQLESYFGKGIGMSGISIEQMFGTVKNIMYIIIALFAAYISKFFVKRRSKEIAVLKTLGLSRRNIWLMFLIENTIIILGGLIIGMILGVLVSRVFSMAAIQMIGFTIKSVGFSFTLSGLSDVLIVMIMVYIIISIMPLYTISKSSITQLLNEQVSNDKTIKFPRISLVLFIIFTALLIYQCVVVLGNAESLGFDAIIVFLINAILVAFFLYRGLLVMYFSNYRKKQKGISSPIKLLSFNHMASNISGVYKMMSFITIISGILIAITIVIFGMFNQLYAQDQFEGTGISTNIVYGTTTKEASESFKKELKGVDTASETLPVYNYGKLETTGDKPENLELQNRNVLVIKKSDYLAYLKALNVDTSKYEQAKAISMPEINKCNEKANEQYCSLMEKTGISKNDILETEDLAKYVYIFNSQVNVPKTKLEKTFIYANTVVLDDNNKVFNKLDDKYYLTTFKSKVNNETAFKYFEALGGFSKTQGDNFLLVNDAVLLFVAQKVVVGIFQIVSLLVMIIMILALMMSIFFRTLENLEKGIDEYVIAKQLGLSSNSVVKAVSIEAFITQVFPFILGLVVSIPLFDRLFAFRFVDVPKEVAETLQITSLLTEASTLMIISSIVIILIVLVTVLIVSITTRINRVTNINKVR